jgi:hypothetical protein
MQIIRLSIPFKHNRSLKVAVQGPALWPTLIHTSIPLPQLEYKGFPQGFKYIRRSGKAILTSN